MKASLFAILALAAFALAGCGDGENGELPPESSEAKTAKHQKITAGEAYRLMGDGEAFILLDVRTKEEFKEKRIDGAILIPEYEIRERAPEELPDKDARIFVYCRSGRRSALAATDLIDMGYLDVHDFGGIIDWPYETVGE
ncbi:MAG: rhodanese-like domain-containing protein [Planctomycetota bacterium]|jgi:rhodanese-related sulfurtransferase|nr:rhodanese-like domain-containing protein [Planctomycetota bacterium]